MGKTYNLYLNSSKALNFVAGTATSQNDLTYNINWSFLPDNKKFKVSFNFHSQNITNLDGSDTTALMVYFDSPNTYVPQSQIVGNGNFCIGILHPYTNTVNGNNRYILQTDYQDNPPIMLLNRPYNSNLRVELQTLQESTATYAFEVATNSRYALILHFEEVDE